MDYSVTLDQDAIGISPMIWVYIPYLNYQTAASDPGWIYDTWADVFIFVDDNFQRCLRAGVPGEDQDRFMATTFVIRGSNTFTYIGICQDAQESMYLMAQASGTTPPTLYDMMALEANLVESWTMDTLAVLLDFALLTQIFHSPMVLQGLPDLAAADQVTGWAECQRIYNPGNAGT